MARTSKSRGATPFSMRSGNQSTFRMMGSTSPVKETTEPTTDETVIKTDETVITQDPRIGQKITDLSSGYATGSVGLTSKAKSREEEDKMFKDVMAQDEGKVSTGVSLSKLLGGEWKKGWTDPKTNVFHENTWSNEDGKSASQVRTGFNPNTAGTVTGGDGIVVGTTEVGRYGKPIDKDAIAEISKTQRRRD